MKFLVFEKAKIEKYLVFYQLFVFLSMINTSKMGKNSFANRLSWSIIGIVSVIYLAALVIIAVIFYQMMTDEATQLSEETLAHASRMYLNLIIVGFIGLVVIFFVCRRVIRTKTRPVTEELQTTTIANERMESELNVARNIQMGMLNTDFPAQLHAILCPAKEVGGDFYDFSLKDDQMYFAIGDVSGKGVPASLMMALTSVIMRFVAGLGLPINTMLERINNSVCKANSHGMFVTLFVARIDLKTGHMEFCNAGHNSIVVVPPDENPYFLKAKPNLAIGLLGDFHYEGESLELKPGTRLIAYTDGVTEAESIIESENEQTIQLYGNDRLLAWAHDITQKGSMVQEKEVVESLYQSVKDFANGNPQNDDIAIMSLKV
jgi:serine phosphatase RsbU (regulator of sigma subunit)